MAITRTNLGTRINQERVCADIDRGRVTFFIRGQKRSAILDRGVRPETAMKTIDQLIKELAALRDELEEPTEQDTF